MSVWWLALILASIGAATLGFIWLVSRISEPANAKAATAQADFDKLVDQEIKRVFNESFREELKNRGRLHFEKIINENSMFLQQDLRLTSSQLNDFMKSEITKKLHEEFQTYEQAITDAKALAVDSIQQTVAAVDEQRRIVSEQVLVELNKEKAQALKGFEDNLAKIVNHYVIGAIGNQIDLSDQLEYILGEIEANKTAILEDISSGA